MKNKFYEVVVFAELDKDNIQALPTSSGFTFKIPKMLDQDAFFQKGGTPTEMSAVFISKMLVEALSANIHVAHQTGQIDSAEHLRSVMERLEDLFVLNCEVDISDETPNRFKK